MSSIFSFRLACHSDIKSILSIFKSVIGTPFCIWDDEYPAYEQVLDDLKNQANYVLLKGNQIIAVGTIRHNEEHDLLPFWTSRCPCDLMRIGVDFSFQKHGIGSLMLNFLIKEAQKKEYDAMRILVGENNLPAIHIYQKTGALLRGEADCYDTHWLCYELLFNSLVNEEKV